MKMIRRSLAAAEVFLIFPAALFMTALFVRNLQPQEYEPARTAHRIVEWYAAQPKIGLWLFLIACPLMVLAAGCITLRKEWRSDATLREAAHGALTALRRHLSAFVIACATLLAGLILAIVALHMVPAEGRRLAPLRMLAKV